MIVFQTILSISSMVIQNCLFNNVCKKELSENSYIYYFNMIIYAICAVLLGVGIVGRHISVYTVILGILFGVVTALANLYKMLSLATGPMHITLLITTSSMIIPTISGVFFGEDFSIAKLVCVLVLIYFIFVSFNKSKDHDINLKWIIFCFLAFMLQGSIGVIQKIHQSSVYKSEINGFLFVSFLCSLIYCRMVIGKDFGRFKLSAKYVVIAIVCGICSYIMNVFNLKLSGLLPSQLFFPIVNGSTIVLSSIMSVLLFKENFSKRQLVGLCGGIISLVAICVV